VRATVKAVIVCRKLLGPIRVRSPFSDLPISLANVQARY
jgi:hypothetical protein